MTKKEFCTLIPYGSLKSSPWKNGGGITKEIAIFPANSSLTKADFIWRLSTAEVKEAGPFSLFPDFERLFTLTKGNEVLLEFTDLRRSLKNGQVLRFNAEVDVDIQLPSGPVEDLGLIYDPDLMLAKFTIIELKARPRSFSLTAPLLFVHGVSGEVSASVFPGEQEFSLRPGDTLRIGEHEQERLLFLDPGEDDARVVAVEIAEIEVSRN